MIVIGSGAGGGTLAGALSRKGKTVLVLERGGAMALEDQNVADVDLFRKDRYHPKSERWFGPDGDPFAPQTTYARGGNTKIWGAVLERMREKDFRWPFKTACTGLRHCPTQAEQLYRVHGRANPILAPPKPIEPFSKIQRQGCQPYDIPISWSDDADDPSGDAQLFGQVGEPKRLTCMTTLGCCACT